MTRAVESWLTSHRWRPEPIGVFCVESCDAGAKEVQQGALRACNPRNPTACGPASASDVRGFLARYGKAVAGEIAQHRIGTANSRVPPIPGLGRRSRQADLSTVFDRWSRVAVWSPRGIAVSTKRASNLRERSMGTPPASKPVGFTVSIHPRRQGVIPSVSH